MAALSPLLALLLPLLPFLLLLLAHIPPTTSFYAHGLYRSGLHLTGVAPLQHLQTSTRLQCLHMCIRQPGCRAMQLAASASGAMSCQLLAETACDGHTLQADADSFYYDIYSTPTSETLLPLWSDSSCQQGGLCSPECLASSLGDACQEDIHCQSLGPPGAIGCSGSVCSAVGDFWQASGDLTLPKWMPWKTSLLYPGFKQLVDETCSVKIRLRLGTGGRLILGAVTRDFKRQQRTVFSIGESTTQAHSYADNSDYATALAVAATGTLLTATNSSGWTLLTFSWCGSAFMLTSEGALFNATAPSSQPDARFLMASAEIAEAELQLENNAADPWLIQPPSPADITDPVFEIEPCSLVTRSTTPSNDVTVTYDCDADKDCSVYLADGDSTRILGITVGGWGNTKCAIQIYYSTPSSTTHHETTTGALLVAGSYITFTVRYTSGRVTVQRSTDASPIFDVTSPIAMADITSIGIGSMWHEGGRKRIRLARYDPAWRVDTWATDGVGYSNMAT